MMLLLLFRLKILVTSLERRLKRINAFIQLIIFNNSRSCLSKHYIDIKIKIFKFILSLLTAYNLRILIAIKVYKVYK